MGSADRLLRGVVVAASAAGVGAFVLDAYDVVAMPFTISFVALPGLLVTLALAAWAGRVGKWRFLRRLYVGVVAGLMATFAYDAMRLVVATATPASFDPFRAHPNFGALMLGTSPETTAALLAGWAYHFWNGISFGVMYALVAGGARYRWAVAWALTLETATIVVYPTVFELQRGDLGFVGVSVVGHLVYGIVLGILCRNWLGGDTDWSRPGRLRRPNLEVGLS